MEKRTALKGGSRLKPSSVMETIWMFAGIQRFGFFDANADRSSGTKNQHERTPTATRLDRMAPRRTVCDDCNVPVSFRDCVLDRRTGQLVCIACPNCAKLIWDDERQAATGESK
jgi:hypothetical protein